ncbi:hypothetical protein H1Z61_16465 [Bacillus aquiflavi]|uniref:VOC domain-containing protein n=1 Tax=Bacillus aquiflavi TaxID=2672567 RepID=A0A6B3W4Z8_9BACI|nr:hypothetical protein [Bacillus aquiflavi]MBA4538673.1 hypothetical protein [Bacillus aquiflavi]NEY83033.1 hypothetical protein [Bacillus aquiflavi]UAC48549.1 hypothetical protein K6959_00650 [Bacillus aquiflavi]
MKIEQLEIFISNFKETVSFYKDMMQFESLSMTSKTASFQAGESIFTIHQNEEDRYYYHFAFNIPANFFKQAKAWIKERVPLLTEDGVDEVDFKYVKANALYFEDPAGNIVEFIARRETSPPATDSIFSSKHILGVSEIGISANEIKHYADQLIEMGIPQRDNRPLSNKNLNFMGEYEDGVFIILGPIGRRWLFSHKTGMDTPVIIKTNRGTIKNL